MRRTALNRKTALMANPDYQWPRQRTRLTVVRDIGSGSGKPAGEFSAAVKLQCRTRAGNGCAEDAQCEACGVWLGTHLGEIQHRLARGSGGSSDPVVSSIVNAVLLCGSGALKTGCHGKCEKRYEDMHTEGFWLKHSEEEHPAWTPILLHSSGGSGGTYWLTADGSYSPYPPVGGAA
jgi:hypothetical protein